MLATYTHKQTKWTRTVIADGSSRWTITPTDGSGVRIVRFLSRNSWANDPTDDKANSDKDRVILLEGAALPLWALEWLEGANMKSCARAREAFKAAIDDADFHEMRRDADSY